MILNRWDNITRPYTTDDVQKIRGSIQIDYTLAKLGAEKFWKLLNENDYIHVLSAVNGNQAIQEVKAGLKAIYVSGWQVAADANNSFQMYPDQSLYPVDSAPNLTKRINNTLLRADQTHFIKNDTSIDWLVPLIVDAEAGFGGVLNAFELMKQMIEAGAAAVHFEDQLSSAKKCGHLGGKVLVPTKEFIAKLIAARLAADVCNVPTILIARTDAGSAGLLTSDIDDYDKPFLTGQRTVEGFYHVKSGLEQAISRGLAYAPYADLLWFETSTPDLDEAREFAKRIHQIYPNKMLAYNCSPSFNWKKKLTDSEIEKFQIELGKMGYKFQFVTLSGFHSLNYSMFKLAQDYKDSGMAAYARLQENEFKEEINGYEAIKHQEFVGTKYFDKINEIIFNGQSSVNALKGSTEEEQFH